MKEIAKLYVYDMGPDWYQGAWGMIMKQLDLKIALKKGKKS
jgi:hypothetical protein